MDLKKGDVVYANRDYDRLTKGQAVRILQVNHNSVDICIVNSPELWLKNIPIEVLQIEKDLTNTDFE